MAKEDQLTILCRWYVQLADHSSRRTPIITITSHAISSSDSEVASKIWDAFPPWSEKELALREFKFHTTHIDYQAKIEGGVLSIGEVIWSKLRETTNIGEEISITNTGTTVYCYRMLE